MSRFRIDPVGDSDLILRLLQGFTRFIIRFSVVFHILNGFKQGGERTENFFALRLIKPVKPFGAFDNTRGVVIARRLWNCMNHVYLHYDLGIELR